MEAYHEGNRVRISVAYDLRNAEEARKLELLRGGLPEGYIEVEVVTEDLVILHIYPGAVSDLPPGGARKLPAEKDHEARA